MLFGGRGAAHDIISDNKRRRPFAVVVDERIPREDEAHLEGAGAPRCYVDGMVRYLEPFV